MSIKGGLIDGLDWSQGKHIFTGTAVVQIPPGVERWEGTPDVMEAVEVEASDSRAHP